MPLRYVVICCTLCSAALLAACDAAPGAEEASSRPPVISDLQYSPDVVVLASLPPSDVTEDSAQFAVSFQVDARDEDGEVAEVTYAIRPPNSQASVVAAGVLEPGTGGRYTGTAVVRLAKGQVGNYTLSVFAVDRSGRMSNTLRGLITFTAEGGPPLILEVIADPDTILVARDSVLTLIAVVDDPDGLENISEVVVTTPNGQDWPMYDDGASQGDPVADDGRYRARFGGVNAATPNTTQIFRFQVFDKTGLESETVEKSVRIE